MPLQIRSIVPYNLSPVRTVERVGSYGLALWTITIASSAPLGERIHWRLADGTKPPLDVALSRTTGAFQEVTFFIQDEKLSITSKNTTVLRQRQGLPQFDTSLWKPQQYDLDEPGKAAFTLAIRDFQVALPAMGAAVEAIDMGVLQFQIDAEQRLVGLTLPRLTDDELSTLITAGVLESA